MARYVTFAPGVITADDEDEIDEVLQRLPPDVWGTGDVAILVSKRFTGAGGALVLQIEVRSRASTFIEVVKVGPAAEIEAELKAWETVIRPVATRMCTPIRHSTLDPGCPPSSNGREAVVYGHVGQFAGRPDATVTTLEAVFTDASLGNQTAAYRASEAIGELFTQAETSLYAGAVAVDPETSLQDMISTLGPDLTLEVTHLADASGDVWSSGTADRASRRLTERTIWKAGSGSPAADNLVGQPVRVDGVELSQRNSRFIGRIRFATVELRGMPLDMPFPPGTVEVHGKVASVRRGVVMSRVLDALPGLIENGETIRAPKMQAPHPFSALREALEVSCRPVRGTRVHGDLNAGNVLLVNADPYLIDYARSVGVQKEKQLLADFAWLEINLMRAIGGDPSLADLVTVQRLVTTAAALLPASGADAPSGLGSIPGLTLSQPGLAPICAVLLRLRRHAYRCYPEGSRDRWLVDYSRHLVLAAHRTFKWSDGQQSATRWAASVATAVVAGEWVEPVAPFRFWTASMLNAAIEMVASAAYQTPRCATRLLGSLTREIDGRGLAGFEGTLAAAANSLSGAVYQARNPAVLAPFMELSVIRDNEPPTAAVEVLTGTSCAALIGAAGTGKSTVAQEMANRLMAVATNRETVRDPGRHRLPVLVSAADLLEPGVTVAEALARHAPVQDAVSIEDLMDAGCLHLIVDGGTPTGLLDRVVALRRNHPRLPLLVTSRSAEGFGADFSVYRLQHPTPEQAVPFLAESAIRRGIPMTALRDVLAGRGTPRIDEVFRTAEGVTLLARQLRPKVRPSLADLLDAAFARLDDQQTVRVAEILAADLVDRDVEQSTEAAAEVLFAADPAGWRAARDRLLHEQVLESQAGMLSFARLAHRDWFAARAAGREPAALPDRALRLSWQEPLRLAAARRGAADLAATLTQIARHTDPRFAARLLAMIAPEDPGFIAEQVAALRNVRAARFAQQVAAEALYALGEAGIRALCGVVRDNRLSPAARSAAIRPLVSDEPASSDEPVRLAAHLLGDEPQPARLRTAAVDLAVRYNAVHLVAVIAEHCSVQSPWHYHQAAHDALRRLGAALPRRVHREYTAAARRRMDRLSQVLPRLTTNATYDAAQREREFLLISPLRQDRDVLLAHRWDFEIGPYAADMLAQFPTGPTGRPESETPLPQDLAGLVTAVGSLTALSARSPRQNETLARLLTAARQMNPVAGAHLAEQVHVTLTAADSPDRLRWPIRVALARCSPDAATVETLLRSDDANDRVLAVATLASASFLLDAAPPRVWPLSEVARDSLRALRPHTAPTWDVVAYLRAAAATGLAEGLSLAADLLTLPTLAELTRMVSHPVHGVLTLTARSEVLSAAGYLARRHPGSTAAAATEQIRGMDLTGAHPSDVTGRLIGLAFLGDAEVVLRGLDGAEPRLHAAARHAVVHWATVWSDRNLARDVVAALLHHGDHDRRAHSTLLELLRELSVETGRLTARGG
ncbi:hypothetical protein [Verrucosispora sp. WMMD573]|uniref:hypothetical protein n=1 Tax=Verrucosispora sp. WMMD573 TaxID=3015149 RepID=UPI00248C0222|nr:hypothetical protein [Verrucosispora sp. WMMD573]WBB52441.1 hypothetical protein O7601_17800 [Verrucosispora sp. WMMD573]